jgi:Domain of Unknown Function (DUF1080)
MWNSRRLCHVTVALAAAAALLCPPRAIAAPEGDAVQLFNGHDLKGFYTFLPSHGKDSDPDGIFTVHDGMVHVLGKEFGYFCTDKEYENYHLIVEFKWGEKRWPPRENTKRDSGVLLHCVGPDKVWMKSIECQIQEGDTGDFWLVDGTSLTCDGKAQKDGRVVKKKDAEKPTGEWNVVEVICDGDKIQNIVNGVVVNEGTAASVTKGKIIFQSEGAEVFYRKIELRPLTK